MMKGVSKFLHHMNEPLLDRTMQRNDAKLVVRRDALRRESSIIHTAMLKQKSDCCRPSTFNRNSYLDENIKTTRGTAKDLWKKREEDEQIKKIRKKQLIE